ncbi:hypothetical protein pb186bvf_018590 [Paramecium bursaria]
MLGNKKSRLPRQLQICEILGSRNLYSLKRKRKFETSLYVQGKGIESENQSNRQDYKKENNIPKQLNYSLNKPKEQQTLKISSMLQSKICNIQFKLYPEDKYRSVSTEGTSRITNHKLRLKTLENRMQNKYYTIQLSTRSTDNKKNEFNITNYRNLHLYD